MANAEVTVTVTVKDEALKKVIQERGEVLAEVCNGIMKQALCMMNLEPKPILAGPFVMNSDLHGLNFGDRAINGDDALTIKNTASITIRFADGPDPAIRLGAPVPPST